MKCPKCRASNPAEAKFCNQCGAALQVMPRRREQGQRRRVAVMFSDISGFTQLSETLDPEEVRDLIDGCLQRLAAVIYRYEGYIDKFIGDCIMALFGAPITHEDDPLRAVIAALDQLKEIEAFNREKKLDLALSIGINYGLVATGDLGRPGEYTVMGDVVNLAQRLQYSAPRGMIYVSDAVFEQTQNEVAYKKLKKITVKGKRDPVAVYNPVDIKRHYSLRKIQELPLIGRHNELEILSALFDKARTGRGHVVSLVGEAGIGKSKLTYEFRKQIEVNARIIEGRGIEYLQNSPYLVLKEMMRQALNLDVHENTKSALGAVNKFARSIKDPEITQIIPFIVYFLDLPMDEDEVNRFKSMKPQDRQRLLHESFVLLFLIIAQHEPLVLVFEDCHWIDSETADFMRQLATRIDDKPLFIVNLYRPEFNIGADVPRLKHYTPILLGPLSEEETVMLLIGVLHCSDIERSLVDLLMKKSGRIPFYVHELTNNLIRSNIIVIQNNIARLKEGMETAVPRTLDELIMAKVDRLGSELRAIIDVASVIGDEFSKRLLDTLFELGEHLNRALASLITNGMIQPLSSSGRSQEDEQFSFSHSLMREAVYQSLLKQTRKAYHRQIGYAIELVYADHLYEYYDALALHFYEAGEDAKRIEYLEKAGDRKAELYMNPQAIGLFTTVLELMDKEDRASRIRICEKLGRVYELIGDSRKAYTAFETMHELSGDNVIMRCNARYSLANVLQRQGKYDEALTLIEQSWKEIKQVRKVDPVVKADIVGRNHALECWIYRVQGKIADAERKGKKAIAAIHDVKGWMGNSQLKKTLVTAVNHLAIVHVFKGEYDQALALCEQNLTVIKDLGNQQTLGNIYNTMGSIYRQQGKFDEAIDALSKKLQISKQLGDTRGVGIAYCNLGNTYQNKGEFDKAIDLFNQFLRNVEQVEEKQNMGVANMNLGIAHFYIGEYERAIEFFEKALVIAEEIGDKRGVGIAFGNMGEVYASQGNMEKAEELLKRYLAISMELGDKASHGSASLNLAIVYTRRGLFKEAEKFLKEAKTVFEAIGNKVALAGYYEAYAFFSGQQGKYQEAKIAAQTSIDLVRETSALDVHTRALRDMAHAVLHGSGKPIIGQAKKIFQEAVTRAESTSDRRLCADTYFDFAEALMQGSARERQEGKKYYRKALDLYKKLNLTKLVTTINKQLKKN
ncbi:tetratricopeptide repeat protein [candidate division WOR-3 bacterium]|nr:tetratricopeptide repeat protein [candidate division WOR-3 bacterium]